jgi:hypothetical protein
MILKSVNFSLIFLLIVTLASLFACVSGRTCICNTETNIRSSISIRFSPTIGCLPVKILKSSI